MDELWRAVVVGQIDISEGNTCKVADVSDVSFRYVLPYRVVGGTEG